MNDPKEQVDESGSGGSSDGDTQPDDTGATGERGDLGPSGAGEDAADETSRGNLAD